MTSRSNEPTGMAFSVDTHLFRELGTLLVGRDSTALIELIKNAYDADATHVVVHAEALSNSDGFIRITDDGTGMSHDTFVTAFLRIAGRSKEGSDRRSLLYRRRFTGAKGIGRLSSYKLAETLEVVSHPDGEDEGVDAMIDWTALENSQGDVQENRLVQVAPVPNAGVRPGTSLTLSGLRLNLAHGRRARFLREVRATRPDPAMFEPRPVRALGVDLLIPSIEIADSEGPELELELTGDLDPGDQPWASVMSAIDWVLEIDARDLRIIYRISPTARRRETSPDATTREFRHSGRASGPRFVARVFIRVPQNAGPRLSDTLDTFVKDIAGVRVFMEGFRVLPYGSSGNDWLEIDRDAVRRNALQYDEESIEVDADIDVRTYQLSSQNYIGAVFLQEERSHGLEMVVNREGFLPSEAFDQVTEIVRRGVDLSVRVRASIGTSERAARVARRMRRQHELIESATASMDKERVAQGSNTPAQRIETLVDVASQAATTLRSNRAGARPSDPKAVELVEAALEEALATFSELRDEQAQIRVLASVGTQFGAFIHEVNSILAQSRIVLELLDDVLADPAIESRLRTRLRKIRNATADLTASLERQAIYLTDTIGAEARKRRSRQRVADRFTTATRLLEPAAERRNVRIGQDILPTVRTPPMFPAEANVVLTNLLSNAIKAAGEGGRVHATATSDDETTIIRVENTGATVDLFESERWFRPFETTTTNVDELLGQGMGLGLSLTRRIVEEYGGIIRFVEPDSGFNTCVEIRLPQGGR